MTDVPQFVMLQWCVSKVIVNYRLQRMASGLWQHWTSSTQRS